MEPKPYQEIKNRCALIDWNERAYIDIKGKDSKKFLNGLLTNNVQKLNFGDGCYACHLTPKGKIVADLFCYACGENSFGIDVAASLKTTALESLKKYIIFQNVELIDQSAKWGAFVVAGPKSNEYLKNLGMNLPAADLSYVGVSWEGLKLWIVAKKLWGLPAYEIWANREKLKDLEKKLGLVMIDKETAEILRIESFTALFGIDFDANTIPQEANLWSALSFDKGCYVGQEIIARLKYRGHVAKQIVQIKIEGDAPPACGEKIRNGKGEEVGSITSSCLSIQHQKPIAIGYIRYASLQESEFKVGPCKAAILKGASQ